jgi:putative membrane protein
MYTGHTVRWGIILRLAWKPLIFFILYGIAAVAAFKLLDWRFLQLPFTPASAIGIAVVFYVGLKNSSSYDRVWEARKIWGGLVNSSRQWGVQVVHLIGDYTRNVQAAADGPAHEPTQEEKVRLKRIQRTLVMRQLAFLNALRFQLRSKSWWEEEEKAGQKIAEREGDADQEHKLRHAIGPYLSDQEVAEYEGSPNAAVDILNRQSQVIRELWAERWIDSFHHVELMRLIGECFTGMGASERIKSFPFPRQYATFSRVFIWLFVLILPFSLIGEINETSPEAIWMTVPIYVIISWVFVMMEIVGGSSENPFENGVNDVPLTSLCRTAEIDLLRMLGEKDLPAKPKPVNDILM